MTRLFIFFLLTLSFPAMAQKATEIGNYGAWKAYSFTQNGEKVCYMLSTPKKAMGNYTRRGDIFALITHRPGQNTKNVFSYAAGYPYKDKSEVKITIDGSVFTLFTHEESAWTYNAEEDNKLTNAIQKGNTMVVKGRSGRGTLTTDTFSLKGSGKAYDAIGKACGV